MSGQSVGLRELRQQASELVRRAESGESVTVTVNGRAAARSVPVGRRQWRQTGDVSQLFDGPPIDKRRWRDDLATFDEAPRDPCDSQ